MLLRIIKSFSFTLLFLIFIINQSSAYIEFQQNKNTKRATNTRPKASKAKPKIDPNLYLYKIKNLHSKPEKIQKKTKNTQEYTRLNHMLESLNEDFIRQFAQHYTKQKIYQLNSDLQKGQFLFLIGKMYLYDIIPDSKQWQTQSRYLLAYHYIKQSAQKYGYVQAYYYLAVLQYIKLNPTFILINNLQQNHVIEQDQQLKEFIQDLKTRHLQYIEHNLYLASLLKHNPASLTLAYMLKSGIATTRNCSSALSYYLSVIKNTKIDDFQFPSLFSDSDFNTFEKELYFKQKYQQKPKEILQMIDLSVQERQQLAFNYLHGINGFKYDVAKAANIFEQISQHSQIASFNLALMHLKGLGVQKNVERGQKLLTTLSLESAAQIAAIVQYLGVSAESYSQQNRKVVQAKGFEYIKQKWEKYIKEQQDNSTQVQMKPKNPIIHTSLMKYIIGSLIISSNITAQRQDGLFLIQKAAKQGNTMALALIGLSFVDGSELSFDCHRAIEYFSSQAFSHQFFQSKIQIARSAISQNKTAFALIKYTQLMMVGYKNAFTGAYYLCQMYNQTILNLNKESWSVASAQKNKLYKHLVVHKLVDSIKQSLQNQYNAQYQNIVTQNNIYKLTKVTKNSSLLQYLEYIMNKISVIGVKVHDISIIKFYKYRKSNDLTLLHSLANSKQQSKPFISEARFLLGKFYQSTQLPSMQEKNKKQRALYEYSRASNNNQMFASILYLIEEQQMPSFQLIRHLIYYTSFVFLVFLVMYWQRNKKLDELFLKQKFNPPKQVSSSLQQNISSRVLQHQINQLVNSDQKHKQNKQERSDVKVSQGKSDKESQFSINEQQNTSKQQMQQAQLKNKQIQQDKQKGQ